MSERQLNKPLSGVNIHYDYDPETAPFEFSIDKARYEERLQEDLGFDELALSKLKISVKDRGSRIKPLSYGRFNFATNTMTIRPGKIWKELGGIRDLAVKRATSNLMHESRHAAQKLVDGKHPIRPMQALQDALVDVVSVGTAYGVHEAINTPGITYRDVVVLGAFYTPYRIGRRIIYKHDPREVEARAFQFDPNYIEKWAGIVTLQASNISADLA